MITLDKGTVIRTIVLALALFNQILVIFGKSPLPFNGEELEQIVSAVFTVISSLVAWYKNNYITEKGKKQKMAIKNAGLQ
ncbi:phage holin [Virgibacillus ihumii]|uniref:phage holin n=1 Tax=Virgibacillus ihumii TaxID=2686091 RepID=UPI00157D9893|nr:phage holin [Virgibacillus ihumii]